MIDFSTVTAAIQTLLRDAPSLSDFIDVARGEYVNVDPANCPWVGVYRGTLTVDPRTLGRGAKNWKISFPIDILVQVHGEGGQHAEDLLGDAVKRVVDVLLSDLTFGNTVEMVTHWTVTFNYEKTDSARLDFQWAILSFVAEVRTE